MWRVVLGTVPEATAEGTWLPGVDSSVGTRLQFHDLPLSQLARLITRGEHPKLIADRLRHASPAETMDMYADLFLGLDTETAKRI